MGIVPVDPSSKRDPFDGERNRNGFADKPILVGFMRREMRYIPTLRYIMVLMSWSLCKRPRVIGIFFQREPGLDIPQ
jgi:hypothetical protein